MKDVVGGSHCIAPCGLVKEDFVDAYEIMRNCFVMPITYLQRRLRCLSIVMDLVQDVLRFVDPARSLPRTGVSDAWSRG